MGGDTPALSRRISQALIVSHIPKVTSVSLPLGLFIFFLHFVNPSVRSGCVLE